METTERIVEAYVRHVRQWATIANIRCSGQNEIDLIAIDPVTSARYHIEVSISIAQGFQKLTGKPFNSAKAKERGHGPTQRRTVGFFARQKFDAPSVLEHLQKLGFVPGKYRRVIVTWGWDNDAAEQAREADIELWDFRDIVQAIAARIRGSRQYFADDTLRTLNIFIHAEADAKRKAMSPVAVTDPPDRAGAPIAAPPGRYWVYESWPNNSATVHAGGCSFCKDRDAMNAEGSAENGQWLGPFESPEDGWARAQQTGRRDIRRCSVCLPASSN